MQSIWPFDEQRISRLSDRRPRLVEIEKHLALGIERGLGRVDVFGSGLFTRLKRPRRKRNHPSALIANGKHHPLAEPVVDAASVPSPCSFELNSPLSPQCLPHPPSRSADRAMRRSCPAHTRS